MQPLELKHYPQYVEGFRNYFESIYPVSDELWKKMVSKMILKRVKKGVRILDYMEIENAVRFLGKGIVKCEQHYNDQSFVFDFRVAPIAICESGSIQYRTPSSVTLETSTECELILMPQADFQDIVDFSRELTTLAMYRVTSYFELMQYKQILQRNFTTEERYKQFLIEFPSVALTCKQEEIASYLNITKQSLSRIRKSITWKKDEIQLKKLSDEIAVISNLENE